MPNEVRAAVFGPLELFVGTYFGQISGKLLNAWHRIDAVDYAMAV